MKKLSTIALFALFFSFNVYSISQEEENQLLMKAMVEGASTPEQKASVSKYLQMIAKDRKAEADKYRTLANSNFGTKALDQRQRKADYLQKAKSLEQEAANYQKLAMDYQSQSSVANNK